MLKSARTVDLLHKMAVYCTGLSFLATYSVHTIMCRVYSDSKSLITTKIKLFEIAREQNYVLDDPSYLADNTVCVI